MSSGTTTTTTTIQVVTTGTEGSPSPPVQYEEDPLSGGQQQIYIIETTSGDGDIVEDVAVYETVSALEQLSRGDPGETLQVYEEVVLNNDEEEEFVEVEVGNGRTASPVKIVKDSAVGEFHVCRVCNQFVPTAEIAEHNARHHGSLKELTCTDCAKIFKSKRSLFGHRKEKHSGIIEVHSCPECGKTFGRKSNLKAHRESLHYGKKFPCSYCDRIFTNRSSMNQHIKKTHTERL